MESGTNNGTAIWELNLEPTLGVGNWQTGNLDSNLKYVLLRTHPPTHPPTPGWACANRFGGSSTRLKGTRWNDRNPLLPTAPSDRGFLHSRQASGHFSVLAKHRPGEEGSWDRTSQRSAGEVSGSNQ